MHRVDVEVDVRLSLREFWQNAALIVVLVSLAGCSAVTSSMTGRLSSSLATSMLNQNDPETVRQGTPAYLLMVDGFVTDAPDNADVVLAAARLYSSYASAFVDDRDRARVLSLKARNYGRQGLCLSEESTCGAWEQPFDEFAGIIQSVEVEDIDALFVAASAWAGWIQANKDDWNAVADKARVDEMMQRVVALDEGYDRGTAHLYLGVLATLLPEALGGKPEEGKRHFERAIELSNGRALMPRVLIASEYARMVFDRELHDRMCQEVLDADPEVEGLTLVNVLAQQEARRLLDDSEDYFGE